MRPSELPRLNPVQNEEMRGVNPHFFYNLPRKPAYPTGIPLSDPLVYNSNESLKELQGIKKLMAQNRKIYFDIKPDKR